MTHRVVLPGASIGERAAASIADPEMQRALRNLDQRLYTARAVEEHHADLKDRVAEIRRETLADLDGWLDRLQATLESLGAVVHRASTPAEASAIVLGIAYREDVRRVVKSKSMATEEIDLADVLEGAGIEVVESDLGEYIVQVAGERPSHMITPAIHKTLEQIAAVLSAEAGEPLPVEREALTAWTRDHLRRRFLEADMGVTGANFVAADTGTIVVVTNEGNGRFCTSLPRIQVTVMPVEKVIPRFADLGVLLPVLTMSATGQPMSNYLSMITGPRRPGEQDGPEQLHVVFLDHNRRDLLGTPYEEMLACIRCGACLNVCPVYRRIGGHAYDAVYSGPMGKILTPLLSAGAEGGDLPYASSLCGACTDACPSRIPLADLLVHLRADLRAGGSPAAPGRRPDAPIAARATGPRSFRRVGFGLWGRVWASEAGYRASAAAGRAAARLLGKQGWATRLGRGRRLPGVRGWTASRDLPLPAARSFRQRWADRADSAGRPGGLW
ncbi:MAG: lactate utilization protein B [Acidimicrobiia bacterium]